MNGLCPVSRIPTWKTATFYLRYLPKMGHSLCGSKKLMLNEWLRRGRPQARASLCRPLSPRPALPARLAPSARA
jgi:hypothetical protein